MAPQEGFMKAYSISTKPSSSAREKCENKISSHFQLNKKPVIFETVKVKEDTSVIFEAVKVKEDTSVIFEAVRVKEDTLCEKSCQTYFHKK